MPPFAIPLQITAATLAVIAAITDWRSRIIPNWLTVGGLALAIVLRLLLAGWPGLREGLGGFALAVAFYLPLYLLHAVGGGDLKLMAAMGAICGADVWFGLFVITAIAGGAIALGILLWRGGLLRALRRIGRILHSLLRLRTPYKVDPELDIGHQNAVTSPHGVGVAIATVIYLLLNHVE